MTEIATNEAGITDSPKFFPVSFPLVSSIVCSASLKKSESAIVVSDFASECYAERHADGHVLISTESDTSDSDAYSEASDSDWTDGSY